MNDSKQEFLIKCILSKPVKYVPYQEYLELVKFVPIGKVTRENDILFYLAKKYNTDNIAVDYFSQVDVNYQEIPLWRVLSTRGYLYDSRYINKNKQQELLTKEGHAIVTCGANNRSLMVKEYKSYLFDFSTIGD